MDESEKKPYVPFFSKESFQKYSLFNDITYLLQTKEDEIDAFIKDSAGIEQEASNTKETETPSRKKSKKEKTSVEQPCAPGTRKIPANQDSCLSQQEQKTYIELCELFSKKGFSHQTKQEAKLLTQFKELHKRVVSEQEQFMSYLNDAAQILKEDYLYIHPDADQYINDFLHLEKKRIFSFPQFYKQQDTISLSYPSSFKSPVEFYHLTTLLEMGIVPNAIIPKLNAQTRPKITPNYSKVSKRFPLVENEEKLSMSTKVCSKDPIVTQLLTKHQPDVVLSVDTLKCLIDNHQPSYQRQWEIPVTVTKNNVDSNSKKCIIIDKPFVPKSLSVREKNSLFHEFSLKTFAQNVNHPGAKQLGLNAEQTKDIKMSVSSDIEDLFEPIENKSVIESLESFATEKPPLLPIIDKHDNEDRSKFNTSPDNFKADLINQNDNSKDFIYQPVSGEETLDSDSDMLVIASPLHDKSDSSPERKPLITDICDISELSPAECDTVASDSKVPIIPFSPRRLLRCRSETKLNKGFVKEMSDKKSQSLKTKSLSSKSSDSESGSDLPRKKLRSRYVNTGSSIKMETEFNQEGSSSSGETFQEPKRKDSEKQTYITAAVDSVKNPLDLIMQDQQRFLQSSGLPPRVPSQPAVQSSQTPKLATHKGCSSVEHEMTENLNDYPKPRSGDTSNVSYSLWKLGSLTLLLKSSYHATSSTSKKKSKGHKFYLQFSPKLEYQPQYGYEQATLSEISRNWLDVYVRKDCKVLQARINAFTSEILHLDQLDYNQLLEQRGAFSPEGSIYVLNNIISRLSRLEPGHYLLSHSPGNTHAQIKQHIDTKVGAYNLHSTYVGYLSQSNRSASTTIPWIPLDVTRKMTWHTKYYRIPATFAPRDPNKSKKVMNQKRKTKRKSKKKKK